MKSNRMVHCLVGRLNINSWQDGASNFQLLNQSPQIQIKHHSFLQNGQVRYFKITRYVIIDSYQLSNVTSILLVSNESKHFSSTLLVLILKNRKIAIVVVLNFIFFNCFHQTNKVVHNRNGQVQNCNYLSNKSLAKLTKPYSHVWLVNFYFKSDLKIHMY